MPQLIEKPSISSKILQNVAWQPSWIAVCLRKRDKDQVLKQLLD